MTSQKTRHDENFPVGSLFIPRHLRAVVHTYYRFARLADDVADSPTLQPDEKKKRLDAMAGALHGRDTGLPLGEAEQAAAIHLRDSLTRHGLDLDLAGNLLEAFRWDADNTPCRTWAELINYCQYSACPVGRFLLALHGETSGETESDALCSALQILNHVQDAADDWMTLRRVYVPTDWMQASGVSPENLNPAANRPEMHLVLRRVLDNTDSLLTAAAALPGFIKHRRLAAEATLCLNLAKRLSTRLRRTDPIRTKVSHSKVDWMMAGSSAGLRLLRL